MRRRLADRLEHRAEPVYGHHEGDERNEQERNDQNELDSIREDGGANASIGRVSDGEEAHDERGQQQWNVGEKVEGERDAGQLSRQEHEHVEDDHAKREDVHRRAVAVPDVLGQRVAFRHHAPHLGADPDERNQRRGLADAITDDGGYARPCARLCRAEEDPCSGNGRNEGRGRQRAAGGVAGDEVVLDSPPSATGVHDSGDNENGGGNQRDGYGESRVQHGFILHRFA